MAIFKAKKAFPDKMKDEAKAYIWLTNLLGILRNDSKDCEETLIIVFGIEIDISNFTVRLLRKKLEKAINATTKIFKERSVSFIDMRLLVRFFSFYLQVVKLGRVFMRML